MIRIKRALPLGLALIFCWTGILFAEYTIVLKNGRRITVKSYREEGEMIKVLGMGGEFGIAKDQIESIINPGADEERGMVVPDSNRFQPTVTSRQASKSTPPRDTGKVSKGEVQNKRAEAPPVKWTEEAEYLGRIKEKTDQLKRLTDRYSVATRGSSGPQSGILEGQEAIRGRTADLQSRLKDAQRSRAAGASGGVPRVHVPPPAYSAKEKELSELRKQIIQTQKERDALIQKMQQKNFGSASASP